MKNNLLVLSTLLCLLNWQCSPSDPVTTSIKTDYDQVSRQLMEELAPQIIGQWTLRQVQIKYKNEYGQSQIKLTKDSTFLNLATLKIIPAAIPRTSPVDTRRGEYDGTITYGSKTYPISFDMLANAEWIVSKKGPQTFFSFQYHFPNGIHLAEPEEVFLQNIGLTGEVFTLETTIGQPTMIWRGLNRGIERIELVRQ
jgi:hypothetical protein